jgi:ParB family chromosome partitioning protein
VAPRRKGFFTQQPRLEDDLARQRDVAALLAPRRTTVQDLSITRIRPNPFQARRNFGDLQELAQAMRIQGFTTRLRVRPDPTEPGFFQLVFGERRLRAAAAAGFTEVPCEIAEHTDDELIEIGLAENIQRRDLEPLEEAQAFRLLIEQRGYTVRRLAERIGKDKSYVDDRLALLRAPEDVQQMIVQRPDAIRAAREIAKLQTPAERAPLIEGITSSKLNTEDVRTIVREVAAPPLAQDQAVAMEPQTPSPAATPSPARGTGKAPRAQASSAGSTLERDMRTLRAVLARWQEMVAYLHATEQAILLTYIRELGGELERLEEALRADPPTG